MKILHVAEGIQETCGVSCFVMEIAKAQAAAGHDVCIVTRTTCSYPVGNLDVRYLDKPELIDFEPEIVHLHCIWNLYVHRMAVWCRKRNIPYVISPHGTLTPWALKYKWWKKIPAMVLYQYRDLRKSAAFHVTSGIEKDDIRRLFLKQNILIAPLGTDIPEKVEVPKEKILLFLSRIHPKKGLPNLISAWRDVRPELRTGWRLVIAGPDDVGHQAELKDLAQKSGLKVSDFTEDPAYAVKQGDGRKDVTVEDYRKKLLSEQADIVFTGPVYGDVKNFMYQTASCFVLPSFSENFGGVVLEALAAGTPVLTTTGTPWSSLAENDCGWQVKPEAEDLRTALETILKLPEEDLERKGRNSAEFVRRNFTWMRSAEILLNGYVGISERKND